MRTIPGYDPYPPSKRFVGTVARILAFAGQVGLKSRSMLEN
jgi:hypothetical protein